MSIITTFYSDEAKTNALYPITKTKAIYDDNNVNLEQRLNNIENAGGFYGMNAKDIIQTSNILTSTTVARDGIAWFTNLRWNNGTSTIYLDGVAIASTMGNATDPSFISFPVKKGQVITGEVTGNGKNFDYTIYGIK